MKISMCRAGVYFIFGVVTLATMGCALFQNTTSVVVYRGEVEATRSIEVRREVGRNAVTADPARNYDVLTVYAKEGNQIAFSRRIGHSAPDSDLDFEQLQSREWEGRTDSLRQRVWLIDKERQRVMASIDWEEHVITGPEDSQPAWARLDGGIELKNVTHAKIGIGSSKGGGS